MNTQSVSPTIKVNLPKGLLQNSKVEAERIGISLQDFIRMLMTTYFANAKSIRAISRDQALLNRATKEIATNQFTSVVNSNELNEYLDNLST